MSNKSLNDDFIDFQVYQKEVHNKLQEAGSHVCMEIESVDYIIQNAINAARMMVTKIHSAYKSGLEDAEKKDGK